MTDRVLAGLILDVAPEELGFESSLGKTLIEHFKLSLSQINRMRAPLSEHHEADFFGCLATILQVSQDRLHDVLLHEVEDVELLRRVKLLACMIEDPKLLLDFITPKPRQPNS